MKPIIQEIVTQRYTNRATIPCGVDEEQELISFCREDLESLIKTIVNHCASFVSDVKEREDILKIGD